MSDAGIVLFADGTPEAVHAAVLRAWTLAKPAVQQRGAEWTDADGEIHQRRWRVSIVEDEDTLSTRQQRFYWGVVLKQIAAQAPGGWTPDAWHEAFKRTVLGFEVNQVHVAGRKRATTIRRLRSTTDLTVKQMSEYLDQVMATATTDLGVEFDLDPRERESVRYQPRKRNKQELAEHE